MINRASNPVAWALLGFESSDAQEHLSQLCREMQEQPDFDETNYPIWLGHIYAHLNWARNRCNLTDAQAEEEPAVSEHLFPTDIKPP